jgi:thiol:disulfide interchange protein
MALSMFESKLAMLIAGLLIGVVVYAAKHPSTTFAADGIDPGWDAAVQNRDTTEPTVVIFTASWCPACQQLQGDVLSRQDVQDELFHHYNVYSIDMTSPSSEVRAHAKKLGVSAIPTIIRYNTKGHETSRIHNSSPDRVMEWLKAGE